MRSAPLTGFHYRERGSVIEAQDDEFGPILMAGAIPRFSETPGSIRWLGPELGAHNDEIFTDLLELPAATIAELRAKGVI